MLRFVGDGYHKNKKITQNPRHFSMQNSQANTKKIFTKFFWRAGKVALDGTSDEEYFRSVYVRLCRRAFGAPSKGTPKLQMGRREMNLNIAIAIFGALSSGVAPPESLRPKSGTKKEPKPKLLNPDIFRWGRGLPHEGVGAKKFGMSLGYPGGAQNV